MGLTSSNSKVYEEPQIFLNQCTESPPSVSQLRNKFTSVREADMYQRSDSMPSSSVNKSPGKGNL